MKYLTWIAATISAIVLVTTLLFGLLLTWKEYFWKGSETTIITTRIKNVCSFGIRFPHHMVIEILIQAVVRYQYLTLQCLTKTALLKSEDMSGNMCLLGDPFGWNLDYEMGKFWGQDLVILRGRTQSSISNIFIKIYKNNILCFHQ